MLPQPVARLHREALVLADELGVALPAAIITTPRAGDDAELRGRMIDLLAALPEGTSELFVHPAADGPGIPSQRVAEARLLRDPLWHRALEHEGLEAMGQW
ncbi:hypothetical protein [Brachybacterium sacelli]|uniref:Uncharacterized protein n=1 Tax=Brachybacterium sacelli TaxID=173364 RepID=A0ABS4X734_9MICO|nr:hypothetical protein [Brachybacterium sacelli]MBP2384285.1 hypothetical protein [Brachybacterium sacelli]